MLSNKMKNYKIFSELVNLSRSWLSLLTLVTLVIISFNTSAEETKSSQLKGISYNTIQSDQIELVFEFTTAISALPVVDTSMTPAFVKVKFSADNFDPSLQETLVNHAGVTNITLDKTAENIVATINLEKLAVFDVALNGNEFSITLNYGQSANIVETLNPAGEQFINQIESLDFRLGEDKTAEVLIYLKDSIVAVDVHDKLGKVHVEFHNTRIIEDLLYKLDVTDFGTIVSNIETFKVFYRLKKKKRSH